MLTFFYAHLLRQFCFVLLCVFRPVLASKNRAVSVADDVCSRSIPDAHLWCHMSHILKGFRDLMESGPQQIQGPSYAKLQQIKTHSDLPMTHRLLKRLLATPRIVPPRKREHAPDSFLTSSPHQHHHRPQRHLKRPRLYLYLETRSADSFPVDLKGPVCDILILSCLSSLHFRYSTACHATCCLTITARPNPYDTAYY